MKNTLSQIESFVCDGLVAHYAIRIGQRDKTFGEIYSESVDSKTFFDMASVTKIMVTTMLALISYDTGFISFDDKVSKFYNVPEHYKNLTIFNLLTHSMGIGYKNLTHSQCNKNNIAEYILSLNDFEVGTRVEYSCPAFILLGKILEKIYGQSLDRLFYEKVALPLNLNRSKFNPERHQEKNIVNSNLTPEEIGLVNDYNCRFLGGVSGNAGLFSCMEDIDKYVQCLLNDGTPLVSRESLDIACKNYMSGESGARGLGFLYVDGKYGQTGRLFPDGSIGHCGHTGQSVFLSRETGLYVIILTDATVSTIKKYGEEKYDKVTEMRKRIHSAIKKDFDL